MSIEQMQTPSQAGKEQPASVSVLGVRVDRVTQQQALDAMERLIAQRRASDQQLQCQQIVTVNPEFVMAAQRNQQFRSALNAAALVLPDGTGVVWAARYLGKPIAGRVTGTDILPLLARRCAANGYRLYLLGAAPGVADLAAARLQSLAPGLQIAGTYAGSPDPAEEDAIIEGVRAAGADVLFVAYGSPAQDLWIYRNLDRLPAALAMGVGGAFDFLAGRQVRAPRLMQRTGTEWLFRLYREPSRWRRILVAVPFFAISVLMRGRKQYGT